MQPPARISAGAPKKIRFADWTMKKRERESILSHAGRTTALPSGGTRRRCIDTPLRRFDVRRGVGGEGVRKAGEHRRDANRRRGLLIISPLHRVFAVVSQRPFSGWYAAARAETYAACVLIGLVIPRYPIFTRIPIKRTSAASSARESILVPRDVVVPRGIPPPGKSPSTSAPVIPVLSVIRGSWRSPPRCSGQSR